jgi:molecular chaperone GrpE
MSSPDETNTGPVIRDLRRIDPKTGQVRGPGQAGPAGAPDPEGAAPRGSGKPARPGRHAASRPGAPRGGGTGGSGDTSRPAARDPRGAAGPGPGPGAAAGGQARAGRPGAGDADPAGQPPTRVPAGRTAANEQVLADKLAERTADLQRVTAEYANYRKRVERDRIAVREQALANVLSALIPVLDDIGRAREHGELVGGFKSVAESLEAVTVKLGLVTFGEKGEPFDPTVHEALAATVSDEVTEPTCADVLQPGYKVGERILRPARVAVAEPGESSGGSGAGADAAHGEPGEAGPPSGGDRTDAGHEDREGSEARHGRDAHGTPGHGRPRESRGEED